MLQDTVMLGVLVAKSWRAGHLQYGYFSFSMALATSVLTMAARLLMSAAAWDALLFRVRRRRAPRPPRPLHTTHVRHDEDRTPRTGAHFLAHPAHPHCVDASPASSASDPVPRRGLRCVLGV
jgi:hypothetical protein